MNIILVISDSLRYDALSCNGAAGVATESFDCFAAESVVFDQAYAASFPTLLARSDLLTGCYTYPFRPWGPLPTGIKVLPQYFHDAGYITMLICDTPHLIRDGHRYDRGYDGWRWIRGQQADRLRTHPRDVKLPARHDRLHPYTEQYLRNAGGVIFPEKEEQTFVARTMSAACHWLEKNHRQRFLLVIDTFDPHEPWVPPKSFVDQHLSGYAGELLISPEYAPAADFTPEELACCRALYQGEVLMVDRWFGRLLAKLEALGLSGHTAVLFMSDHGFLIGEHGYVGKTGTHLYREISRINLMFRLPGQLQGARCSDLVQPVDVLPTLLELAGLPARAVAHLHGKSFLPVARWAQHQANPPVKALRNLAPTAHYLGEQPHKPRCVSLTDGQWTLLWAMENLPAELYWAADQRQQRNLIQDHPDIANRLFEEHLQFLSSIGTSPEIIGGLRFP